MHIDKKTALIIILLISLCLNLVLLGFILKKDTPESVIGTYCTGDGTRDGDKYLVFKRDGSYVLYYQFMLIEEGGYSTDDGQIYSLKAEDASEHYVVLNSSDVINLLDLNGEIATFTKISSTPMFINAYNSKTT